MPPALKFTCEYAGCTHAFAKRNHLERHQRTHTRQQEFSCPVCHRKFSRTDSRDRHVGTLHRDVERSASRGALGRATQRPFHSVAEFDENEVAEEDSRGVSVADVRPSRAAAPMQGNDRLVARTHHHSIEQPEDQPCSPMEAAEQLSMLRSRWVQSRMTSPPLQDAINAQTFANTAGPSTASPSSNSLFTVSNSISTPSSSIFQNDGCMSLDVDPMICSLLWGTIEASISEASGSSDLPHHREHPARTSSTMQQMFGYVDEASERDVQPSSSLSPYFNLPSLIGRDGDAQQPSINNSSVPACFRLSETAAENSPVEQTASTRATRLSRVAGKDTSPSDSDADTLSLRPTRMARRMISDLQNLVCHIEAPVEPVKDLASSCFWLCQRHLLPTSALSFPHRTGKWNLDDHAIVMNLIAVGSHWHYEEIGMEWGKEIWRFVLRVVWSRGMRNICDGGTLSKLMTILLSGHSYVLMSCDPAVHRLGRRAWLFCHVLRDQSYLERRRNTLASGLYEGDDASATAAMAADEGDVELDRKLSSASYRDELRRKPLELQDVWRQWCKLEDQIRVACGIYIFDSQHATWLDMPPSIQMEVRQQKPEPAVEGLIEAKSATAWLDLYADNIPQRRYLDGVLYIVYRPFPNHIDQAIWGPSQLGALNILESIYSSWLLESGAAVKACEYWNYRHGGTAQLGLPCSMHALANWRMYWETGLAQRRQKDHYCLLLRWHSIHMSFCTVNFDIASYLREQTRHLALPDEELNILQTPKKNLSGSSPTQPASFFSSPRGRQALWHAGVICTTLTSLSRGASTPIHVAQAAHEAVLLLVSFARYFQGNQSHARLDRPMELLGGTSQETEGERWSYLGLAGLVAHDGPADYADPERDWGETAKSRERKWIIAGHSLDCTVSGLPIQSCVMALKYLSRTLEESQLKWCLARDHKNLIDRTISLL